MNLQDSSIQGTSHRATSTGVPSQSGSGQHETINTDNRNLVAEMSMTDPGFSLWPLLFWPVSLTIFVCKGFANTAMRATGLNKIPATGAPPEYLRVRGISFDVQTEGAESAIVESTTVRWIKAQTRNQCPRLFTGSYSEALQESKRKFQYLLIILVSELHDDTPLLMRILRNSDLNQYLDNSRFIVWTGSILEEEGMQVAETLVAGAYPFFALAAPRFHTGTNGFRMSVIARMDGLPLSSYNPDDAEAGVQAGTNHLVDWMSLPISAHDRVLQTARLEQEERERTRVLREQQDAAYVASLERDRIREQELQRKQLEEQERTRKKEARRSVRLEARDRRRLWRLHTYNKYFAGDEPTGDNICTLTFRLSNGTRIRRKFSGDDPIERIYAFIESSFLSDDEKLKDSPLSLKLTEVLQSSSRNNLEERPATFHFLLVTTFPRREIYPSKDPIRPALEAVKMWPSGAFIAEPTGDDSDLSSEDEGDGENEGGN